MVDFARLQEVLKQCLEEDRAVQSVETVGPTLEAAIADAATLLNVPTRHLEYEVMEKGSPGFMGVGKKEWRIQAYEKAVVSGTAFGDDPFEEEFDDQGPVIENRDGQVFVHLTSNGDVQLKVTPPSGSGREASETYAMHYLNDRNAKDVDWDLVRKMVARMESEYAKVGVYEHHSYNDSVMRVELNDDEMRAYMQVTAPGEGGSDISFDTYINILKSNRIISGIKEEFLRDLVDHPIYGERLEIAVGNKPIDGKDAYIKYNFDSGNKVRLKEGSNGKIDFKELNIIQNVMENQPLAIKIAAERGISGKTVTGKITGAINGKDTSLPIGTNTHLADDGVTILSDINGQVIVTSGLINVEPIHTVNGDVNLKTGNIIFLGTVIIKGNVEDGFSIKAAGNIEVHGIVSKAELEAEGDIVIHQGINGKEGGLIQAGKSLWARFIENANIRAGDMVFASDGIINSNIDATNRIICEGKRASIMGGRLRAGEEINAKVLGNATSGTETICEVGFDPKSKMELDKLQAERDNIEKQLEDINRNIQTLINIKKQRKSLPEDKEAFLQELMDNRNTLTEELDQIREGIQKIQTFLHSLKTRGRVSASTKVYPGVKVVIRDAVEEVRTEYKAITFILENGIIRVSKYEEPDESARKGMDGYSTN